MLTFIRTEMRVIAALISFIMMIIFLLPLGSGIINLGNCAGAFISGVLTAVFLFWGRFSRLVSHLWESRGGRVMVCAVAALIAVGAVAAAAMSFFMVREMRDAPKNTDTTVVVLGCKVKNGAPSLMLRRRLDAAYGYLSENPEVRVVVSGGQGADESISEAQCMREYLVSRGIAPERIYEEDKSATTDENLRFSHDIIVREGLPEHITIVTDGFHQLRSDLKARSLGMEAYNISAHTPWWLAPTYWVREWFGIAYYTARDVIS
ncbi:MAG: YdcF family protein [Ruminococcus sp.]|nr:YdcF family protein [Ruminococcus sp.]